VLRTPGLSRLLQFSLVWLALLHSLLAEAQSATSAAANSAPRQRPNILWIVGDDLGIQIGPYGDANAITPALDRLASVGSRFAQNFAVSPTCSPSRSALITGRYPTAIGTQHHRSRLAVAPQTMLELLADSGYHIAWPKVPEEGKTDFNFEPPKLTQAKSNWPAQVPPEPFFAYINDMVVHEGKLKLDEAGHRRLTAELTPGERQDPKRVKLPPYYPDTPEVRQSLARYGEMVTAFDRHVEKLLDVLRKAGVLERTIVMVFGDNGRGFPRGKRLLYEEGIRVPLIIAGPGVDPGVVRQDLTSLLDLAPTTLSLAGVQPPRSMSGRVIVGPAVGPPPSHVIAVRDRTEDVAERMRFVHDGRFLYITNFMPEVARSSVSDYARETPVWKVLLAQHENGMLDPVQEAAFFESPKPAEELYDVSADPFQIRNLAALPEYASVLERMRTRLSEWRRLHDTLGDVPEAELIRRGVLVSPSRSTVLPFGVR
jgi:uncharacterized sulfatase